MFTPRVGTSHRRKSQSRALRLRHRHDRSRRPIAGQRHVGCHLSGLRGECHLLRDQSVRYLAHKDPDARLARPMCKCVLTQNSGWTGRQPCSGQPCAHCSRSLPAHLPRSSREPRNCHWRPCGCWMRSFPAVCMWQGTASVATLSPTTKSLCQNGCAKQSRDFIACQPSMTSLCLWRQLASQRVARRACHDKSRTIVGRQ